MKTIEHTFILEPYKTLANRYTCPACEQSKTFTRYINHSTGEYLADHVGRCNRESNCGYHYTPKQYFQENPQVKSIELATPNTQKFPEPVKQPSFIDIDIVKQSFHEKSYYHNQFVLFLADKFGITLAEEAVRKYCIGSSKYWSGATVFWQLDTDWMPRAGKIMLYDRATGKRVKQPFNHIHWVHRILKLDDFNLKQCFFGEHLLDIEPPDKPIAIVESEKTAVIAFIYKPDLIWLASGGISNISSDRFKHLQGRKIILFPDLNGYDKWMEKAKEIPGVVVSDLLETVATDEERQNGLDLADYLLRFNYLEFWTYPKEWDDSIC
ncbi:DUF6371 domain-containing protein [Cytophagaceae bacterium YF14B1]|uniref:DUF6371 domain-containing protein n=1 Tax=Xanthocytophaga flava TaxID=3048013 RepID=A0AAE3QU43_9BACT|nr:DUF6371 domain-containing protein [Xanthocytophaga flavus]MDJ1483500.1 DUF6371 domain-containing protein [Xanthocytophaga flavus]